MPIIIPANSAVSGGFDVDNSLRFNSGSSDFLNRTPDNASNRRTFTISTWIKRSKLGASQFVYNVRPDSNGATGIFFTSGDVLFLTIEPISKTLVTNRVFRDTSAWYHIVYAIDTTQGTAANRIKLYVNGVQETSFSAASYPDQNADLDVNTANVINIGRRLENTSDFIGAYLSEFVFIDGLALAADSFGEFDEDSGSIWKPINVSGLTFGTNGFYLNFKGSGTSANASGMGADTSGNTHHFAVNNLTAVDQSTDTCTNNGATWNSLIPPGGGFVANTTVAWSEGNTVATLSNGSGNYGVTLSTIGMTTGKFYCEIKYASSSGGGVIGIRGTQGTNQNNFLGGRIKDFAFQTNGHMVSGAGNDSSYGGTWGNGNIIGIALDLDNNKLYFSKNGTFENSGDPTSGSTGTGAIAITPLSTSGSNDLGAYFFGACEYYNSGNAVFSANFGSPPYAISSGNQDADGFGNFEYAVPSGYFALNTKNLAEYG